MKLTFLKRLLGAAPETPPSTRDDAPDNSKLRNIEALDDDTANDQIQGGRATNPQPWNELPPNDWTFLN